MKKKLLGLFACCLLLGVLLSTSVFAEDLTIDATQTVKYQTHVQNEGWQEWKYDGDMSGTSGKSLRLEGIRIETLNNANLGIEYATHVQNYGWQNFKTNGDMSGTSGEGLRLEAIRIRLTGTDAANYDVWYHVHAQNVGWMGWAQNGADSGTAGYGYRLEGIEIKILPKGSPAPGSTVNSFKSPEYEKQTTITSGGTLKVGTDILAGDYLLNTTTERKGYVSVLADSAGKTIIDNSYSYGQLWVHLEDGQYLEVNGYAGRIESETELKEKTGLIGDGMYKVGTDIPAGEYKLTAIAAGAYYETNTAPVGSGQEILSNEIFNTDTYVTVKDGEYLILKDCTLTN